MIDTPTTMILNMAPTVSRFTSMGSGREIESSWWMTCWQPEGRLGRALSYCKSAGQRLLEARL